MKEYTIYPMTVGANETDQGVMTYLRGYGKRIWIPIYVFLIKGSDRNILVDTGLEQFVVPDHVGRDYGLKIMEFEDALKSHGLAPEDIDIVIHTHLHNDHCENDYKCTNAKIVVQRAEYDFFLNPHPLDHRYYPDLLDGLDVEIVEGDVTLDGRDRLDLFTGPYARRSVGSGADIRRPGRHNRILLQCFEFPGKRPCSSVGRPYGCHCRL